MKMHVVYDVKGQVIGGGVPLPPAYDFSGPRSGPMAFEEQHVGEMEVPAELTDLNLSDVAKHLEVDTSAKPHRLTAKKR